MWRFLILVLLVGCDSSRSTGPARPPTTCWAVENEPDMTLEFKTDDRGIYAEQRIIPDYYKCRVLVEPSDQNTMVFGDTLVLTLYGKRNPINGRQYHDIWAGFYSETVTRILYGGGDTITYKTGRKILKTAHLQWIMVPSTNCCGCDKVR